VKYLTTSTKAAEESLSLVREQYNVGKTDFNRVLNVEQLLTQQEDQLAVAEGRRVPESGSRSTSPGRRWQIRLENEGQESEEAAEEISGEEMPKTTPLQEKHERPTRNRRRPIRPKKRNPRSCRSLTRLKARRQGDARDGFVPGPDSNSSERKWKPMKHTAESK